MAKRTIANLKELCKQKAEDCKYVEAIMRANNGPLQESDLFVFPEMPEDCPLFFACIRRHPDNKGDLLFPDPEDLFFFVPVDTWEGMVGICDVVENNEYFGMIVARCGYGFWLRRADLPVDLKQGRAELGMEMAENCRKKVAELARGKIIATAEARQTELDPNYYHYMDDVNCWVTDLTKQIRGV